MLQHHRVGGCYSLSYFINFGLVARKLMFAVGKAVKLEDHSMPHAMALQLLEPQEHP